MEALDSKSKDSYFFQIGGKQGGHKKGTVNHKFMLFFLFLG
jgi:hypothetical protein